MFLFPSTGLGLVLFLFTSADAHGRLTRPYTRNPHGYEDDPVLLDSPQFVCRNAYSQENFRFGTNVTAGGSLDLQWDMGAAHGGDCALYISYDFDKARRRVPDDAGAADTMEFFKIANFPDCKAQNNQPVEVFLPSWLPAGQAVLRWEWIALHVTPNIEYYTQCVDVLVFGTQDAVEISDITTYPIQGVYPANGEEYRNPYETVNGLGEQFVRGPPCGRPMDAKYQHMGAANNCDATEFGTTGYIDVGQPTIFTYAPTSFPTATPTATPTSYPTAPPTLSPTAMPTSMPTKSPTAMPTQSPTVMPTAMPTTAMPSQSPTAMPTAMPTQSPTVMPTAMPTTAMPSQSPTAMPTTSPSLAPTEAPTPSPTSTPTSTPTAMPTQSPTAMPTLMPTLAPTTVPTSSPTATPAKAGLLSGENGTVFGILVGGLVAMAMLNFALTIYIFRLPRGANANQSQALSTAAAQHWQGETPKEAVQQGETHSGLRQGERDFVNPV